MLVLRGHSDAISCLVTDESSDLVFSAGEDLVVIAWQLDTASPLFRIRSEATTVRSILLLPDKHFICCEATVASVWNYDTVSAESQLKVDQETKSDVRRGADEGEEEGSSFYDGGSEQNCFKVRTIEICDVDNEATCACLWFPSARADSLSTDTTLSASKDAIPGLLIGTANGLIKKVGLSV